MKVIFDVKLEQDQKAAGKMTDVESEQFSKDQDSDEMGRLFSVSAFSKLARTTRDTLHHYDNIGLLEPALRGKNNYRYYSSAQLSIINVIHILQELGMSLEEIIEVKDKRSPQYLDELYTAQVAKIDAKIAEWLIAKKMLQTYSSIIHSVEDVDERSVSIQHLGAQRMALGQKNDFRHGRHAYSALFDFYEDISRRFPKLDLNYPVWGMFSKERIEARDWKWPDRYYLYTPQGRISRPEGLYAVGYARGGYGQTDDLYKRVLAFIEDSGYQISGDTYEEYPLNELTIADENNYLIRLLVSVCKID